MGSSEVDPGMRALAARLTADDVLHARFTPTRMRDGYSQDEVDELLDRVVATLRGTTERPVTAAEVHGARFHGVTFRDGYDTDEVDEFLDLVVSTLEA